MEKVLAFIDESGDPLFNIGASARLEFSAILINESDKSSAINDLENIQKELNLPEFKSNKVRTERRRIQILDSLDSIEFKFINLSINKSKVLGEWKLYPEVFYKYTQKILNAELHRFYDNRTVTIDKFGTTKYQNSLKSYIETNLQLELFKDTINFESAKDNILVQLADFYAGTHRKLVKGDFKNSEHISSFLAKKELHILTWPDNFQRFIIKNISNKQDKKVAEISINYAEKFIKEHRNNPNYSHRIKILEYLIFQAKFINHNKYIYSNELMDWLKQNHIYYSEEDFRKEIIGSLRDEGIVIASSRKGLKIPMSVEELNDYIKYTSGRYLTIIRRFRETYRTLNASSLGKIDLFESEEFRIHKELFKIIDKY